MFKNYSFSILIIGFFILIGCSRTEDAPTPTQLQVTVKDKNNDLVSGASVFLYGTETDWANGTNVLYSGYTDSKGILTFDLEDKKYYVVATYNCLANRTATSSDYTLVVSKNTLNKKEIKVLGAGLISFRNNSQYSELYQVYQNNVLLNSFTVPAYSYTSQFWYPDGYYDFTVKYLPNGATISLGHNYYLNCGASVNFYYP